MKQLSLDIAKPGISAMEYARWLSIAVLVLLGLLYIANGVSVLLAPGLAGDLGMRWREQGYLVAGVNPYDVSAQFGGLTPTAAEAARIAEHDLQNEAPSLPSGYPPWGFAASFLFVPHGSLPVAQLVFATICLSALGLTLWYAYALGRRWGVGAGLLLAAAVFAMFGNASTLRLGQYGLILNAFLLLSLWLSEKGHAVWSGLAMAVVAIKPNYSLLQVGAIFARRQWLSVLTVAVACILASMVPWMLTGVSPIEMVQQMLRQSANVTFGDTGLLGVVRMLVPNSLATAGLGLIGVAVTLFLGWRYRNSSTLVACSVAAVIGRLCFYHRQYDNVMLMVPLLTLGLLALTIRRPWAWVVFAVYGLSLWLPIPLTAYTPPVVLALCAIWLAGCFVICWQATLVPPLLTRVP